MMSSLKSSLRGIAICAALLAGSALGDPAKMSKPLDPANFDKAVPACQDFYTFATGGWTGSHPIPASLSRWSAFDQLSEQNLANMHEVMDRLVAHPDDSDPDFPRIANYYKSCMDESRIEKDGEAWLKTELAPIDKVDSLDQAKAEIARLQDHGVDVFFNFGSTPDGKDSDIEDAALEQGGLTLPNRDFYVRDDAKSKSIRDRLVAHIAKMFVLAGEPEAQAQSDAAAVLEIETDLAKVSRAPADLRDPIKNYNLLPVDEVEALSPEFDWKHFMTAIDAPTVPKINVGQPDFVKGLGTVLSQAKLESLKAYMRWHVMHDAGNALPQRFIDEEFDFSRTLSGAKELRPRWQRCLRATTAALPDAVGKAFVKNLVPAGTKERMVAMVNNIRETLREDIQTLDWMSPETKTFATQKLDKMTQHIAYPDHPIDYSAVTIGPDELYGDAVDAVQHFEEHRDLAKIGKPTDHDEWHMSAMITNAYYNPPDNSITFPAGILFPPFFDVHADDAVNYGGIGVVIGHEMTHGFDDEGRNYDEKGNLTDWWTESDAKNFASRGQCIANEFDGFVAVDDLHENGKLEEGEAIADLGGTTISYNAFQKTQQAKSGEEIDGMTPDQRFFAAFAQIWEQNIRPEQARTQALSDPHPLAHFRVIGTLENVPNFAKAYQCQADSPMVRKDVCKIW
jgi:endothelin-converting enzyme/putative endopeptidase